MQYSEGSKKYGWFPCYFLSMFLAQSFNDAVDTVWFVASNSTARKEGCLY